MTYIPALNEIERQAIRQEPEYPENPEEKRYIILYPDDYEGHGVDVKGNVALMVDEEQAREIKRLAEGCIEALSEGE